MVMGEGRRVLNPQGGIFFVHLHLYPTSCFISISHIPYPIKTSLDPILPLPYSKAHLQLLLTIPMHLYSIFTVFTQTRDLLGDSGAVSPFRETMANGKSEQWKQHLFPSTFPFAPGELTLSLMEGSVFTLVLESSYLELFKTALFDMLVASHMWLFKLIKIKNSFLQLHQPHINCLAAICG